jgi:protein SCO1
MTSRRDLVTIAATAGIAISAGLWLRSARRPPSPPPPLPYGTRLDTRPALPAVELVDERGSPAGRDWFRDRWRLLFFGFTRCPEFCPVTLQTLRESREQLADLPPNQRPEVVLVTVDPAGDDPAALSAYLQGFGDGFHGLTGDPSALAVLYAALGVSARRMESGDGSYMYDHGTGVYVIDPEAHWVALLPAPHVAANVTAAYRAVTSG